METSVRGAKALTLSVATVLLLAGCGGSSAEPGSGHTMAGMTGSMPHMTGSAMPRPTGPRPSMAAYPSVTPGPAADGPRNEADLAFATAMISHHGQAVQLSDLVRARTQVAGIKAIAERIRTTQQAEIATLAGWVKGWGSPVPDPYAGAGHAGMDGTSGMAGMLTDEQLRGLLTARGAESDRMFLTLMQDHHRGAVEQARAELAKGANPEVKKLAQAVVDTQTKEIAELGALLTTVK